MSIMNNENKMINSENKPEKNAETMNFESALARLEQIVRALEAGSAPLDESLLLYEEGVKLVRLCNDRLENAERRIKVLVDKGDGELTEEDFAEGGKRG